MYSNIVVHRRRSRYGGNIVCPNGIERSSLSRMGEISQLGVAANGPAIDRFGST